MGFKIIDLNNIINTLKIKSDVDINKMTFIELGEQEFKITYNDDGINENIRKFIDSKPRSFKKNDVRYSFFVKDYLNFIFKSVDSTDIECLCCYSFKIDLGRCLKIQHFYKTYDVINNNGTTEHVGQIEDNYETDTYNPQYEVFRNIHNLLNVGGFVFNCVPYLNVKHGAYNYDLTFFEDLIKFNNYEKIYLYKEFRGKLEHVYCCFKKKENIEFISIEKFKEIRGLLKRKIKKSK